MAVIQYRKVYHATKVGFWLCILLLISGCITSPSMESRQQAADELASTAEWHGVQLPSTPLPLYAYLPASIMPADTLTVYIEGDGLAWINRRRVSDNPTPRKPIALELALLDKQAAAYLARPCQYMVLPAGCDSSLWTSHRFSADVVLSSSRAIDDLKQRFKARQIRLIGYSGGGAIAALLAARRNDVIQLITIAGNLDHVAWTRQHKVSPLTGSLNPADEWQSLQSVPQVHFVGLQDDIVSETITQAYMARFPAATRPTIHKVEGADHHCCWAKKWPSLQARLPGTE